MICACQSMIDPFLGRFANPQSAVCAPQSPRPAHRSVHTMISMTVTRSSLLRRVRNASDAIAWREFYGVYEPLLLAYVRSRGLQESDTRDVVADVFVKLYQALPDFELDHSRGRFRTWLWRITMNALTDWQRRRPDAAEWPEGLDVAGDAEPLPDERWDREYMQRIVQVVVEQVRQQTQASRPAVWRCYEQHILNSRPAAEVARELSLTTNAVYVYACRVQKRVREMCLRLYEEDLSHDSHPMPCRS